MEALGSKVNPFVCHRMNQISSRGIYFGDNPLVYSVPSLMLQLSLITIITRLIHFFLKPFGQPIIVSQILGGVVLGPSVMGQNSTFLNKVFPPRGKVVFDTLSFFGFMLFIFLIGVKVDPTMALKSGRKALVIGILSFFVPYGLANFVAFLLNEFLSLDNNVSILLPKIVELLSMTAFPVISCFLDDIKILNSEIGRLASSSSFICEVCHWLILALRCISTLARTTSFKITAVYSLSFALFLSAIIFGIRPAALWAIRRTPEGRPVKEIYTFMAMVAVMGAGFMGEMIGISAIIASLAVGLMIPDGPPLGAAFVERLDCFVSVLLMPLYFAMCGQQMDVFSIHGLKNVGVLQLVVLVAFIGKSIATMLPLLFGRVPFRDALSLALIMNTKGIVELAFLNDFRKTGLMSDECYAILLMSIVALTGTISPLVKILYDPSERYIAYKRRTILHSRPNEELRILACLHSPDNVRAIISLLQASNPKKESPINLVVLHLVRLMGRASSLLVSHHQRDTPSPNPTRSERIFSAFRKMEQQSHGLIMLHCYKGISPYPTMHDDVCYLALEKRSILIIIPFHKQWTYGERVETSFAFRNLNKNVLEKAPCSVGILIDRGNRKNSRYLIAEPLVQRVAVLFFGGPDDREALAYGQRMVENPNVTLSLIRFTASNTGEIVGGVERSKMLDSDILSEFKQDLMGCNKRVSYREEAVENGMGVVAVARLAGQSYDLVLVGRRHRESQIMFQLSKWEEKGELGAVGEILAGVDLQGGTFVLVVQQQTKLWGLHDPEESTHLRRLSL